MGKRAKREDTSTIQGIHYLFREQPFLFYWKGGRKIFRKKKSNDPFFKKKNIQDRKSSTIRFVLFANK